MKDKMIDAFWHYMNTDFGYVLLFMLVVAVIVFLLEADFGTQEKKRQYNRELVEWYREGEIKD